MLPEFHNSKYMSAITAGWLYVGWGAVLFETNYGLMQHSPSEIKERLLKALDKEYNVVDMAAVLEIVTILERTPITKEALETTRLGRDINELRRKTKNESLAKRAKDLVRRWRDLILPQSEGPPEGQQNGGGRNSIRGRPQPPPISPAMSLPNSDKSGTSPVLPSRVEAVPKTHAANKRLRKDEEGQGSGEPSPEPPEKRLKLDSPPDVAAVPAPREPVQRVNGDRYDSVGSDCEIVSVTPARPKRKSRRKTPKDRVAGDATGEDIVKEKIASIARIPKVKTTRELLAGLRSRSGENPADCVPPSDRDMARNKTEHIARFLRSQEDGASTGETNPPVVDDRPSAATAAANEEEEPPSRVSTLQTAEEILARLPPLDLDSIIWGESPLPSPGASSVKEEDVDRLLNDRVEGLNGNRDERDPESDEFREWHQVVSRVSYQGTLLHILPYVMID